MSKMQFNWHEEKAILRALLNTCIRNGCTYEETKKMLETQFCASCTVCIFANLGKCVCDTSHMCFVENALSKYLEVAKEKCKPAENDEIEFVKAN